MDVWKEERKEGLKRRKKGREEGIGPDEFISLT